MIAVLKSGATNEQIENLTTWLESRGLKVQSSKIEVSGKTVLGLIGDTSRIDPELLEGLEMIESVTRMTEPYKSANRKFHPDDSVVDINGVKIGGSYFQMIAGPCSVESHEQIISIAKSVKAAGATMLRGGAFKPRTSPYDFQGLQADGLDMLKEARRQTGLPIVSEVMNVKDLDLFEDVDVVQIGARNMQNFDLLKEIGRSQKPVLLKRGLANTIQEMLMSAEYVMAGGNPNVILCERGIRTFETMTRNTLDISAVSVLQKLSHLPVVVDPSHASGLRYLVEPMSLAAAAAGASGIMIEVHNDPDNALCDGPQSLTPEQFEEVARKVRKVRAALLE